MSLSSIAFERYAFSHAPAIFPWYARTLALGVSLFAFTNWMRANFCLLTAADQSFCAAGSLITTVKAASERACQCSIAETKISSRCVSSGRISEMSFSLPAAEARNADGASWTAELKPIPPYFAGSVACSNEVSTILPFEIDSRLNRKISSYFSRRTGCLKHGDERKMKRSF